MVSEHATVGIRHPAYLIEMVSKHSTVGVAYPAHLTKKEGIYHVAFPDFPGCAPCFKDFATLAESLHTFLVSCLCRRVDDHVPPPSALTHRDGAMLIVVHVDVPLTQERLTTLFFEIETYLADRYKETGDHRIDVGAIADLYDISLRAARDVIDMFGTHRIAKAYYGICAKGHTGAYYGRPVLTGNAYCPSCRAWFNPTDEGRRVFYYMSQGWRDFLSDDGL